MKKLFQNLKKEFNGKYKNLPENEVNDISFVKGPLNDVIVFLEERFETDKTVEKMDAMRLSDVTLS